MIHCRVGIEWLNVEQCTGQYRYSVLVCSLLETSEWNLLLLTQYRKYKVKTVIVKNVDLCFYDLSSCFQVSGNRRSYLGNTVSPSSLSSLLLLWPFLSVLVARFKLNTNVAKISPREKFYFKKIRRLWHVTQLSVILLYWIYIGK